ncbi:MAG TPA: ABC transporter permease [Gammaproteobacteria bacterium]|nr:ABC transporter permease [Gammaproteobacteria bacterium]
MLKNYVLVAFQHLVKQKLYTLINVVGLSVGLACFVLISLFVRHELVYDRGWTNADRIVRISRDFLPTEISKAAYLASLAAPAADVLKEDFPIIETIARIRCCDGATFRAPDGSLYLEGDAASADKEILEVFDFRWLRGDPKSALAKPNTVVLTRSIARKYFGDADPVGQTMLLDGTTPLDVTGVIEDLKDDTHLKFSLLMQMPPPAPNWGANAFYTYALLRPGANPDEIRKGSDDFFERRFEKDSSRYTRLDIFKVADIHLKSHKENEMSVPGSASTVRTFAAVAVFILLLACINFMNLATARATQRAKEIGVRKVVGADRRQIVVQFLAESVLIAGVALLLAMAIVEVALPAFNAFLGTNIAFHYLDSPGAIVGLVALTFVTGLLAGSYPAFYLAAFEPGRVLKGDATRGGGAAAFRRGLVVLQFAISIALLIATGVVFEQTRFARDIDLGYDKERIVVVTGSWTGGLGTQWEAMKQEWLANSEVAAVTASNLVPGMENTNAAYVVAEGHEGAGSGITDLAVDFGFFELYGIEAVAGRVFDEQRAADRPALATAPGGARPGSYVIGESLARRYGWTPEEATSKWLSVSYLGPDSPAVRAPIVGVVKDVHFESIRSAIEPTVYMLVPDGLGFQPLDQASLKVTGRNLAATLADIDAVWSKFMPDRPIARHFLDADFEALYATEQRQGEMFTFFALLAIGIACLGLFGLASFTTERRTKEIGIRKTIGGGVGDIVLMFCGEFGRLVLVANLVAWPVAYIAMQRWLSSFAYRADMSPWIFVGSALAALAIACITVGGVAARAASTKPARALRYE